jgi:hypothetical protein
MTDQSPVGKGEEGRRKREKREIYLCLGREKWEGRRGQIRVALI